MRTRMVMRGDHCDEDDAEAFWFWFPYVPMMILILVPKSQVSSPIGLIQVFQKNA